MFVASGQQSTAGRHWPSRDIRVGMMIYSILRSRLLVTEGPWEQPPVARKRRSGGRDVVMMIDGDIPA